MDTTGSQDEPAERQLHPFPLRIMHWTNAVAMLLMVMSGWQIYNDEVLFGWLHFPNWLILGAGPQGALQWHFFAMWILVLNGIAYVTYGFRTGRFRRMLLPIRVEEVLAEVRRALHLQLEHEDLTRYNAVQRLLYIGVIAIIVVQVLSGVIVWKPVQFSELSFLFYNFQGARLVHFLGMLAIVGFVLVHVALALIVPQTLVAMLTGGPKVPVDEVGATPAQRHSPDETTMSLRTPSSSLFRPKARIDQSVLEENKKLIEAIDRRKLLRGGLSLGAIAMLSGCSISDRSSVSSFLQTISEWNDRAQAFLFRPNHLAPTFSPSEVVKPPRFNAWYDVEDMTPVDVPNWKLELAGMISDKRPWTARQIAELPEQDMIIRHICVEGWDYIGHWGGVNFRQFLERVGADLTAKYVAFKCFDGYYGSIDMASALHPQTILATKYAGQPITEPFGSPLRLRTAVKLGFKNPKWITSIEVTNKYLGGYWEDRGFNWFSGI